jgi:hypothetical protein
MTHSAAVPPIAVLPEFPPGALRALSDAFSRLVLDVRRSVGDRTRIDLAVAFAVLIEGRLARLRLRFVALVERAIAGTLTPPRPRPARPAQAGEARPEKPREKSPFPSRPAWLFRLVPQLWTNWAHPVKLPMCTMRLREMIEGDAALPALLASDARFGRILRPLWNMLTTDAMPEALRLPPRAKQPRPAGAVRRSRRTRGDRVRGASAKPAAAPPPEPPPPPPQPPPYGTMTDWTPTELTRGPRVRTPRDLLADRPPVRLIFRSLW